MGGLASAQPVKHELSYYKDYRTVSVTPAQLIASHDGQCGSWASFLLDALRTQGIDQANEYVLVNPIAGQGEGFIVNAWEFSQTPSGTGTYKWENAVTGNVNMDWNLLFAAPNYNTYAWLPGADVTETPGEAGQNNLNPNALFRNHQFVRLTVAGVTRYFDPSYGVEYASMLDFDDNHLAGYFTVLAYDPATNVTTFRFRKNVQGTLEVDPLYWNYPF